MASSNIPPLPFGRSLATRVAAPIAAGLLAILARRDARADTPPAAESASAEPRSDAAPPPRKKLAPRLDLRPGEKREPQDYEGRPRHSTVGEDLLWIPRVLFFPVYAVTDFVIRRPLGAFTMLVEKHDVIPNLVEFFTFGPNDDAGLVPTGFYDFGFQPSVGFYFFWDNFLVPLNALRATVSTGGPKWFKAKIIDRIPLAAGYDADGVRYARSYLQLGVDGLDRPDMLFFGIGYDTHYEAKGRFEERTSGVSARVHVELNYASFLESWWLVRRQSFSDGDCSPYFLEHPGGVEGRTPSCHEETLKSEVAGGAYPTPPSFDDGYADTKVGGRLVLDSRPPRPRPGSGAALDVRGEIGTAFADERGSWASYGATLAGFLDLTGTRRVLSLSLDARFVDPFEKTFQVPFTELVGAPRVDYVPEDDLMRGFVPGRLLGRSSIAATLEYDWPIWAVLDGTLQFATGNVFASHLEDFRPERLRFSFVGGVTSANHRDHAFNLLLGFGTRPIEEGGSPESVRFLVGGTTGF